LEREDDKKISLEAFSQGQAVVPFWGDHIYQRLQDNLKSFDRNIAVTSDRNSK
jgi:hypothetical protein